MSLGDTSIQESAGGGYAPARGFLMPKLTESLILTKTSFVDAKPYP